MHTNRRTALRTAIAATVLTGAVAAPTAAFAAGTDSSPSSSATASKPAKTQGDDKKDEKQKDTSSRTVQLKDGKYAVITKLADGSYKAVVTGPDGFVFGTLTASSPSLALDGGLKVTLDQKTGRITQSTTGGSKDKEQAKDTASPSTGKKLPKGGVAAGEAPGQGSADTDPALIGGALAAAGVLGGTGVLLARRRPGTER
ncbi:hypothetical protein ACWD4B_19855 [Streptomyces sp. NPDC002536]